jgi:hypothetical protein
MKIILTKKQSSVQTGGALKGFKKQRREGKRIKKTKNIKQNCLTIAQ